jgi:hypothetical protein
VVPTWGSGTRQLTGAALAASRESGGRRSRPPQARPPRWSPSRTRKRRPQSHWQVLAMLSTGRLPKNAISEDRQNSVRATRACRAPAMAAAATSPTDALSPRYAHDGWWMRRHLRAEEPCSRFTSKSSKRCGASGCCELRTSDLGLRHLRRTETRAQRRPHRRRQQPHRSAHLNVPTDREWGRGNHAARHRRGRRITDQPSCAARGRRRSAPAPGRFDGAPRTSTRPAERAGGVHGTYGSDPVAE